MRYHLKSPSRFSVLASVAFAISGCMHLSPMPPRGGSASRPEGATVGSGKYEVLAADYDYFRSAPLMVPVDGITPERVKDSFFEARDGGARTHLAIDILAPTGTPVLAATRGKVARLKQGSIGGITLYATDDAGKFSYYYAHLDRYADGIVEGKSVDQGDLIGYVGTTGNAPKDTPHLHFQVMRIDRGRTDWWNGDPVDVRQFLTFKGQRRGR